MYFEKITSLEELKKEYISLLKKHHPDKGGSEEITKKIIAEYEKKIDDLKNNRSYRAEHETLKESDFEKLTPEMQNAILAACGLDLEVELIGSWLWVFGDTFRYKDTLKQAGYKWAPVKKAWYFRNSDEVFKRHKPLEMDKIRSKYGSEKITAKTKRIK